MGLVIVDKKHILSVIDFAFFLTNKEVHLDEDEEKKKKKNKESLGLLDQLWRFSNILSACKRRRRETWLLNWVGD